MERDAIEHLLPTMYQLAARPGSPLDALIHVMADLHRPDEELLGSIETVFDPYRTPDAFVPWLTRWVGLDWLVAEGDEERDSTDAPIIPVGRLRDVVAAGAELAQWRGSERGLLGFLRAVTGVDGFTVTEPDDRPFHLVVGVPPGAASQAAIIERVVDAVKPAATTAELAFTPDAQPTPEPLAATAWPAPLLDPSDVSHAPREDDDPPHGGT